MDFKLIMHHDINIRHTANGGCVVTVGCGTFAFSKPEEMLEALTEFYKDPDKMIDQYNALSQVREVGHEEMAERPRTLGRVTSAPEPMNEERYPDQGAGSAGNTRR